MLKKPGQVYERLLWPQRTWSRLHKRKMRTEWHPHVVWCKQTRLFYHVDSSFWGDPARQVLPVACDQSPFFVPKSRSIFIYRTFLAITMIYRINRSCILQMFTCPAQKPVDMVRWRQSHVNDIHRSGDQTWCSSRDDTKTAQCSVLNPNSGCVWELETCFGKCGTHES